MITIRPAKLSDRPILAAVQAASWKDAYRDVLPADYLTDALDADLDRHWQSTDLAEDDVVLVAEEDEIIGFIAVWVRPDPYIDNLHVRPGLRSKGTGRRLMAAAAERLTAAGHATAYLWVVAAAPLPSTSVSAASGPGRRCSLSSATMFSITGSSGTTCPKSRAAPRL
jgi:ribosomal protein S18 acetylase RimI-like enzyme